MSTDSTLRKRRFYGATPEIQACTDMVLPIYFTVLYFSKLTLAKLDEICGAKATILRFLTADVGLVSTEPFTHFALYLTWFLAFTIGAVFTSSASVILVTSTKSTFKIKQD